MLVLVIWSLGGKLLWKKVLAEANDGAAVSAWFDVNSQSTVQNNAIQATSANQPLYKTGMINDLPALKFDGASDYFEAAYNSVLNPDKITIFAVARVSSVATYGTIVSSRNTPPNAGYMVYAAPNTPVDYEVWFGDGVASWGVAVPQSVIALDKAVILSSTNNGTSTSLYKNGTLVGSATAAMAKNTSKPLRIGGGRNENLVPDFFFNGYIGEIIIFSRVLTAEERKAVEGYLGKKWNIVVS